MPQISYEDNLILTGRKSEKTFKAESDSNEDELIFNNLSSKKNNSEDQKKRETITFTPKKRN